jgi:hypothetical protein
MERSISAFFVGSASSFHEMIVLIALLLYSFVGAVAAEDIPALREIPATVAAAHPELTQQRTTLLQDRGVLRTRTQMHNGECRNVESGTPEDTRCSSALATLTTDVERHIQASSRFNKVVVLQTGIDDTRARIKDDQNQLQRLGIPVVADAFETWAALGEGQKRALEESTIMSAISLGVNFLKEGSRTVKSLNPPKANALIKQLTEAGVTDPFLERGIREVAMTSGKPEMAKNVEAVAERIEKLRKGYAVGQVAATEGSSARETQLKALAAVLGTFLESPGARVAEASSEFFVTYYYAEKARGVIEPDLKRIIELPDQQLENVKRLSSKMRKDVEHLNQLKQNLRSLP